jgi:hypothetical protein
MQTSSPFMNRPWGIAAAAAGLLAIGFTLGAGTARLPRASALTALVEESFAVCTAPIDGGTEGFFILDFETGDLTGGVLNAGTSKFGVGFRHNVLKDLGFKPGKVKSPRFMLVPGAANFTGNAAGRMAASVLYVTDAATGVTVAYGIPWNAQQAAGGGGPVVSEFVPLDIAKPRGGGGAKAQ